MSRFIQSLLVPAAVAAAVTFLTYISEGVVSAGLDPVTAGLVSALTLAVANALRAQFGFGGVSKDATDRVNQDAEAAPNAEAEGV